MDLLPALVGLVVAALVLWLIFVAVVWLHRPSRELAGPLLRLLPDLFRLTRRVATDSRTPRSVRLALVGLSVWILSPIDLLPEFLPGIGPLDDIIVAVPRAAVVSPAAGSGPTGRAVAGHTGGLRAAAAAAVVGASLLEGSGPPPASARRLT